MSNDLKSLMRRVVNKLRDDDIEQGTLGVHRPDTSVDMQVTGRPGWLHVTLDGQTPVKAFNKAGVPQTVDLQVEMRVIDRRRVIIGMSGQDNLSVPVPTPPSGVALHASTHQHGGSDEIATATPAANAIPKADAGGTLNDWVTAGAVDSVNGMTGDVVLDPDDLDDSATTNKFATASNVAGFIDGATVSSTMSTTDKIAAVIGGTLRYFTYQTIRDAITSYISSVVQTFTNKSIDASTNTLTNVNTSALANDAVSNTKLANMAQNTIKGRVTASTGDPEDLTAANVLTIIQSALDAIYGRLTSTNTWTQRQVFSDIIEVGGGIRYTPLASGAITAGQTWTIDVTLPGAGRRVGIFDFNAVVGTNSSNVWAAIAMKIVFRAGATAGDTATIISYSGYTGSGSSITVTGPTAIADGIRFTLAAAANTTSSYNFGAIITYGNTAATVTTSGVA